MKKLLKNQRGQSIIEVLVGIIGIALIAFLVSGALTPSVGGLHDKTVKGITDVTGSGF